MNNPTLVETYDEFRALPDGAQFAARLTKDTTWRDRHAILFEAARRPMTIVLYDGKEYTGVLAEAPNYFDSEHKVWMRLADPQRKSRKSIPADEIEHILAYKAPAPHRMEEALNALIAESPTEEQVKAAKRTAALAGSAA